MSKLNQCFITLGCLISLTACGKTSNPNAAASKQSLEQDSTKVHITQNMESAPQTNNLFKLDTQNEITGKIIGPIHSGSKEAGNELNAFYLKLNGAKSLNDESSCGEQTFDSLPILASDFAKYKGKNVKITARLSCVEERLGRYALSDVTKVENVK